MSVGLKIEVTMKKLLGNKFWKQGNFPGKIFLTKIPKLRGETNLSLILLTIQPIQNLSIFYQILTCCSHPMHNIARFLLKFLFSVLSGEKVLKICWLGQKFQWEMKQIGNLVVVRENAAKFLFEEKNAFTNKERSDT